MVSEQQLMQYLDTKSLAWSPKTLSAERSRLRMIIRAATVRDANILSSLPLSATLLWRALESYKTYTRQMYWDAAIRFYDWLLLNGYAKDDNPFRQFRVTNGRQFKHSYQRENLEITWDEALARINTLSDPAVKRRALQIIYSGQRYAESCQPQGKTITGKGNKPRPDFRPEISGPQFKQCYATFWRKLRQIGLKPHTLRKLALTQVANNGGNVADIMEVAGWSSVQTAAYYLQPKRVDKLKKLLGNN